MSTPICEECHCYIDPSDLKFHARSCSKTLTAYLVVYSPCDCGCEHTRWFYCTRLHERLVAEYSVEGCDFDAAPYRATERAIKEVLTLHRGCSVLNLNPPENRDGF